MKDGEKSKDEQNDGKDLTFLNVQVLEYYAVRGTAREPIYF